MKVERFYKSNEREIIVVLKDYGSDYCLIAIRGRTDWTPDAQIRLARRRVTGIGIVYQPVSFDRSPAYQEVEKTLRSLGLNVCSH
jgi:hypothetical protein